jgi:DNA-binding IclR family transcriptional regulator
MVRGFAVPRAAQMKYRPYHSWIEFTLTRICQVIANPNSRRVIEILAGAPMTIADLQERVDLPLGQLESALTVMQDLKLVRRVRVPPGPTTYSLDEGGLTLVRSWLDRIASISDGEAHLKR